MKLTSFLHIIAPMYTAFAVVFGASTKDSTFMFAIASNSEAYTALP